MGQYYPPPADICMICARYQGSKDPKPNKRRPGVLTNDFETDCVQEVLVCKVYPRSIPEDILLGDERPDCFRLNPDSEAAK